MIRLATELLDDMPAPSEPLTAKVLLRKAHDLWEYGGHANEES